VKLIEEMKQRKLPQGIVAYAVAGWLLIQLAIALESSLELPPYVDRWVTIGVIVGFPVAVLLSWFFDISLNGISFKRDQSTITGGVEDVQVATLTEPASEYSIAVLPFVDMSPDKDQEYLGDGIAEEILNALVKVTALRVTGRTSSFSYKGSDADISQIGNELNVAHVLEGSVRKQANRVRITAQLIQVSDGFHSWSETFDGDLSDIFDLQDEIAKKIVDQLEVLLDAEGARLASSLTKNQDAYDAFLRGRRNFQLLVGEENLPQAVKHLEHAVQLDPEFHEAWAFLALAHLSLPEHAATNDPDHHYAAAESAIGRARRINPNTATVERATALLLTTKRDFFGAMQAFERASKLAPNDPTASVGFGSYLTMVGLAQQAILLIEKAVAADPSVPLHYVNLGASHYIEGDIPMAIQCMKRANQLGWVPSRLNIAFFEAWRGRIHEAYAWMRNYLKEAPPWFKDRLKSPIALYVYNAAILKRNPIAIKLVGNASLARISKPDYSSSYWDAYSMAYFCDPPHYFEVIRGMSSAYAYNSFLMMFYPTDFGRGLLQHEDFPQFAEDMGLIRIWQTYGWPTQVQPKPGTDGSNRQITIV
jgi:TolB-like protein/Flp pilus assembly protein TadD